MGSLVLSSWFLGVHGSWVCLVLSWVLSSFLGSWWWWWVGWRWRRWTTTTGNGTSVEPLRRRTTYDARRCRKCPQIGPPDCARILFALRRETVRKRVDPLVTIDGSSTPSRAVRVRGRASPPDEDAASWSRAVARRRTLAKGGASGAKPQQPQQRRRVGRGRPSVHELWRGGMLGQGALEAERRPSETRRCGHGQAPAAHVRSRRAAGCSGGRVV